MGNLPFSESVEADGSVYIAGQIGLDPATGRPPEDPQQEARLLMEALGSVLKRAGLQMRHLVMVTIYASDVSLWEVFNAVYVPYFEGERLPARAFIGSGRLLFDARFELTAIAVR